MTAKKKLAIYLPTLASGGAEKLHVILSSAFMAAGYDVTFVLHRITGAYVKLVPEGVKLVELGSDRTLGCLLPLVKYLKSEKPDILLSNLGHNNIMAIWAGKMAGVRTRIIASHHSALTFECRNSTQWQYRILPFLCRIFLPWAHANVAVSKGAADDLAQATGLPREKITVIYNPVELIDFENRINAPVEHAWVKERAIPYIVGVGRLTEQKNFSLLLDAFAKVTTQKNVRLILVGEGPLLADLKRQAITLGVADKVSFAGFQPNPLPFMNHASVLVMSSLFEGFGNVLVEALACGTPVVSVDCPYGPAEILEDGKYGRLAPLGDSSALAEAIMKTLSEPAPEEILKARGREFTVTKTAHEYTKLFTMLLSGIGL